MGQSKKIEIPLDEEEKDLKEALDSLDVKSIKRIRCLIEKSTFL